METVGKFTIHWVSGAVCPWKYAFCPKFHQTRTIDFPGAKLAVSFREGVPISWLARWLNQQQYLSALIAGSKGKFSLLMEANPEPVEIHETLLNNIKNEIIS